MVYINQQLNNRLSQFITSKFFGDSVYYFDSPEIQLSTPRAVPYSVRKMYRVMYVVGVTLFVLAFVGLPLGITLGAMSIQESLLQSSPTVEILIASWARFLIYFPSLIGCIILCGFICKKIGYKISPEFADFMTYQEILQGSSRRAMASGEYDLSQAKELGDMIKNHLDYQVDFKKARTLIHKGENKAIQKMLIPLVFIFAVCVLPFGFYTTIEKNKITETEWFNQRKIKHWTDASILTFKHKVSYSEKNNTYSFSHNFDLTFKDKTKISINNGKNNQGVLNQIRIIELAAEHQIPISASDLTIEEVQGLQQQSQSEKNTVVSIFSELFKRGVVKTRQYNLINSGSSLKEEVQFISTEDPFVVDAKKKAQEKLPLLKKYVQDTDYGKTTAAFVYKLFERKSGNIFFWVMVTSYESNGTITGKVINEENKMGDIPHLSEVTLSSKEVLDWVVFDANQDIIDGNFLKQTVAGFE